MSWDADRQMLSPVGRVTDLRPRDSFVAVAIADGG